MLSAIELFWASSGSDFSVLRNKVAKSDSRSNIKRLSMGHGGGTSVTIGASMAIKRPKKLQIPMAVETTCVGKRRMMPR